MRGVFRPAAWLLGLALASHTVHGQPAAVPERPVDEYRVKAAVLYNLAKFVSWPASAFAHPDAPFVICVLGTDPFGAKLDDVVRGHRVSHREVRAQRVSHPGDGCHLLFVAQSEYRRLPDILEQSRGRRVLTVGEGEDFTTLGGMVGLRTKGNHVRFDINLAAATAEQLNVSARLLSLATGTRRVAEEEP
jgi:hypothetical protein